MPAQIFNWRAPLYRLYEERIARRNTFRYLDFLDELQWQPEEEVLDFQWRELRRLVRHAYENVPFHRRRFEALGVTPDDLQTPEDYARLPLMEKRDFAEHQAELLSRTADPRHLFTNGSGGSTGVPMRYQHDHDSYEWRQAAHVRGNTWAGAGPGRREFHLWGEPMKKIAPLPALKKRLWHWVLNHHYANSYRLTPENMAVYLDDFNRLRPDVLIGYSYSLYLFAKFAEERGTRMWSPRGIIGTAEKMLPHQRETVERVFGARVFDRYGCREVMLIGMECEAHRGLHLTADNLYVEILADGRPARPGEVGEVVVTDLHNYAMPFLRYRNGDLAVASDRKCSCGRGLPMIEEVRGRTQDALRTPDGRTVSGIFVPMFFKDYPWVEEFQLEQAVLERIDIRLKPAGPFDPEQLQELRVDLQEKLGPRVALEFKVVDEIPRAPSGKHRPVVSRLQSEAADRPDGSERTATGA